MLLQLRRRHKAGVALRLGALVRRLAWKRRVRGVRREGQTRGGGLRAESPLTGVLACVRDEGGGDGEGHAAQVALVRLLPRVAPLVVGQRAGLGEGLAADVADVRLLSAVQPARGWPRINEGGGRAGGGVLT